MFRRALIAWAGEHGRVLTVGAIRARPWASATFEGERVAVALAPTDLDAAWSAGLAEAELHVRGYLVADLSVEAGGAMLEALLIRAA